MCFLRHIIDIYVCMSDVHVWNAAQAVLRESLVDIVPLLVNRCVLLPGDKQLQKISEGTGVCLFTFSSCAIVCVDCAGILCRYVCTLGCAVRWMCVTLASGTQCDGGCLRASPACESRGAPNHVAGWSFGTETTACPPVRIGNTRGLGEPGSARSLLPTQPVNVH